MAFRFPIVRLTHLSAEVRSTLRDQPRALVWLTSSGWEFTGSASCSRLGLATATFSFDLNPLNVIGPQQQVAEFAHQRSREVGAAGNIIGEM